MANCLIGFPNRIDECSLSGGTWQALLPQSNLKVNVITDYARTSTAADGQFVVIMDMTKSRSVKLLCLVNHNFSTNATYRITGASDSGFTSVLYTSGILPVWNRVKPTLQLNFEDLNWWDGLPLAEDLTGYAWTLPHILSLLTTARYWKVEVFDSTNTDGFLQCGRIFISDAWVPVVNMMYGAKVGFESDTKISKSRGGTKYYDPKLSYRVAQMSLDNMSIDEGYSKAYELNRLCGLDKEVFFMYNYEDTVHLIRRSFIANLRKLSPIEQPYHENTRTTFEFEEII